MEPMRRTHARTPKRQRVHTLTALLALVALALQAFVIQPHVHAYAELPALAYEQPAEHTAPGHAHVDAPHEAPGCIICQALASSGHSTLPDAIALAAYEPAQNVALQVALRDTPRLPLQPWQSRAPPIHL